MMMMRKNMILALITTLLLLTPGATGFTNQQHAASNLLPSWAPKSPPSMRPSLSVHYANSALFTTETTTPSRAPIDEHSVNNRHSASDWLYNARSIFQSEILREVRGPVLAVAGWSFVVSIVHRICLSKLPAVAANMSIPGTAHSFLVSALGLLLVFRTNSAYQRFYEGRKIWENILSISRNISRMVQLYSNEIGHSRQRRIRNLVAAFPYLLRHHIRPGCLCANQPVDERHRLLLLESSLPPAVETRHEGDKLCGGRLECLADPMDSAPPPPRECYVDRRALPWSLLPKKSLPKVAVAHNRPLWVCDRIGKSLMGIPYGPNFTSRERLALLGQVEKLTNAVGQCERIHQTAVPLNYARHSLRSLTLWLFTLPFCLLKDLGLLTAPVTACIAWILFGVYQIGYSIEDPFQGSLRLSILCDAIRRDVVGGDEEQYYEYQQVQLQQRAAEEEELVTETSNSSSSSHHQPNNEQQPEHDHYQHPLPLLVEKEEAFLKAVPKLVEENGTWNVVGQLVGEGP